MKDFLKSVQEVWVNYDFNTRKWVLILSLYAATGGAIYLYNAELFHAVNGFHPEIFQWLMLFFSVLADGSFIFLIGASVYKRKKGTFWAMLAALAVTSFVVQMIKHLYPAPRPIKFFGEENIFIFGEKLYTRTFPSGHTTAAFVLTRYLQYGETRSIQAALLFFGVLAGLSRIYIGVHFPFDVFIGGGFGYVVTHLFLRTAEKRKAHANRPEYRNAPLWIYGIGVIAGAFFLTFTFSHYKPLELESWVAAAALTAYLTYLLIREILKRPV